MLLFGLIAVICVIGIVHYERLIAGFMAGGYITDAFVISKDMQKIKGGAPREPAVKWYYLTVRYTDRELNTLVTQTIATTNRAAKRKQPDSSIKVVVSGGAAMLKEDMPGKAQVYFLTLMLIISSVIVIMDIASRLV